MKEIFTGIFILFLAFQAFSAEATKDLKMDKINQVVEMLPNGHFNVEDSPQWRGVALWLSTNGPLKIPKSHSSLAGTKITFKYFLRSSQVTSVGPYLEFVNKKTENIIRCRYLDFRPTPGSKGQDGVYNETEELGPNNQIKGSFTLSLKQMGLALKTADYMVVLFYGPISSPQKLSIFIE